MYIRAYHQKVKQQLKFSKHMATGMCCPVSELSSRARMHSFGKGWGGGGERGV